MMIITVGLLSILCAALVSGCPDWYLETGGECECKGLSDYSAEFAVLCNQDEKRIGILCLYYHKTPECSQKCIHYVESCSIDVLTVN